MRARSPRERRGVPTPAILALTAALLACLGAGCSDAPPPPGPGVQRAVPAPGAVLVRDTSVLEVDAGRLVPGQDVLLAGGRIAAVGPHGSLTAPAAALVVDGRGATLLPGLIDMHGHIQADTSPSWIRSGETPELNLRAYAYAGVTTVFDPADMSDDPAGRRDRVAAGELVGPRIYTTGPILTCPDGHPISIVQELAPWWISWLVAGFVAVPVPDAETARAEVDRIAASGTNAIKIVIDAIPLEAPRMTPELARAVVEQARAHGLRTVAHIGTTEDAIRAADAGVALWVHGVYKEPIPDDQIAVLAGYGIPMVATVEVFDRYGRANAGAIQPIPMERETVPASRLASFWPVPKDFDVGALRGWIDLASETMDVRIDNVRRLRAAGVTILAGSDTQSGVFPGAGLHRELAHLVRAGMTPVEAIRAATLDPAIWLANGAEPDAGLVAPGKRADLLLVEGDPTRDVAALQRIRQVFLAGVPLERTPVPEGS